MTDSKFVTLEINDPNFNIVKIIVPTDTITQITQSKEGDWRIELAGNGSYELANDWDPKNLCALLNL